MDYNNDYKCLNELFNLINGSISNKENNPVDVLNFFLAHNNQHIKAHSTYKKNNSNSQPDRAIGNIYFDKAFVYFVIDRNKKIQSVGATAYFADCLNWFDNLNDVAKYVANEVMPIIEKDLMEKAVKSRVKITKTIKI